MNESRRRRKLAPARISLVKISDGLQRPLTWDILMVPSTSNNVGYFDGTIVNPFPGTILSVFDMAVPFRSEIVTPLNTCFVVII